MSSVDDLAALIGAPTVPPPPPLDWDEVAERTGLSFPDDYRQLSRRYASIDINEYLAVPNLALLGPGADPVRFFGRQLSGIRQLREDYPESVPFPIYPEPGGLFPWGYTPGHMSYYWRTDSWTVVCHEDDAEEWFEFDGTAVDLLVAILSGKLREPFFPGTLGSKLEVVQSGDI